MKRQAGPAGAHRAFLFQCNPNRGRCCGLLRRISPQKVKGAHGYFHCDLIIKKLRRLSEKYPDKIYPERKERPGAVSYIVPKACVSVREPFSDERRRAASQRAKQAGITPPKRSVSPKSE